MRRIGSALVLCMLLTSAARADVTFEYLYAHGFPNSVSADGKAIAGNGPTWGAYRWTQSGGIQDLGRDPTPSPGGSPAISADGSVIGATILASDSTNTTSGVWSSGSGWTQLFPPAGPAGLSVTDRNYSDVYGISGDGLTVVGLYWHTVGHGHGYSWTAAGGGSDLGSTGRSSIAYCASYDGSVIGGWDENSVTSIRQPATWVNGTLDVLDSVVAQGGEVHAVNSTGTLAVGFQYNPATTVRENARWVRTGGTWTATQYLGSVPGTAGGGYGINVAQGVSSDGKLICGYCSFDGSPYNTTGFVWTDSTGTIDVNTWLANSGVYVDPGFLIESCQCMTPDGTCIIGSGQDLVSPYTLRTFRINIPKVAGVPGVDAARTLALAAPWPNPARGVSQLAFTLPAGGESELAIFDAGGRRIATLAHGWMPAGRHTLAWDGRDDAGRPVADGLYWARLASAGGSATRRLVRIH